MTAIPKVSPLIDYPKLKRKKKKKMRDGRYAPERLRYLHGKPCTVNGCAYPGNVHHIHDGGQPPNDWHTIPLCHLHHQGLLGVHTLGRKAWEKDYGSLAGHLQKTDEWLIANGMKGIVKG